MAVPPVRSEVFTQNSAGICWLPALRKYAVVDFAGHLHGYRNSVDAARELAASLPRSPQEEPHQPAPIPRSPKALPPAQVTYLPPGVPRDERTDFFESQAPQVVSAFERSRALCRRQATAHDRVYRRNR